METFQEAGVQMLKEFRALLQHSPLPLPGTRLLQLLALNMFAIESTQLKGESSIFLSFPPSYCSFILSLVDFLRRRVRVTTNFLIFPGENVENGEFWNSRLLSRELFMQGAGYRCELCVALRMGSIRLPIRDLNLDGFSCVKFRMCICR